ncbi:dihydrodipicolinate synthase family protein [Leifsonia sp. fls2-241-R2A-40a]|uniref:dihydrodipicolinate synthase family protein n=1 Tax=Leifsonia sp. fls2-241-R2A-40a TaxID=3040290 RepID=UPI002550832B|nr:dihydrodipicolinate synthase family protein [Leifsonia sp. fls2-241-R2A-40a]
MNDQVLTGILPVAPTVFRDDEELDLDGQQRIVDFLVDARADGVCVLANYSEQFSLTDEERVRVVDATLARAEGRLPVVVAASHFSARVAAERARQAEAAGASMVMLMPPFFGVTMSVPEGLVLEYFKRVADGLSIDIMIQDAPLSTTPLSVHTLAAIAREVPQVRYAKVEVPRAAEKIRQVIAAAGSDLPGVFDGEEGVTAIPDLEAGAVGTMSSCLVPEVLGEVVRLARSGELRAATARWEEILPLIHYENRQAGLVAAKAVLQAGGVIRSDRVRAPLAPLPEATRAALLELAARHQPLALTWGAEN